MIPMARGGPHNWNNLQCAHRKCNSTKGAKV
jgi:5-methylcytosine-specific restriction endonuclease McrA